MVVERQQGLTGFVQLDQVSDARPGVAHDEPLTVPSGCVESDWPTVIGAMNDGFVEGRDHEGHVVDAGHWSEASFLVLDDEFDHQLTPLSVGG